MPLPSLSSPLLLSHSPTRFPVQKPAKLPSPRKKKKAVTFNSIPSSPPVSERRRRSRQLPASGGYLVRRTISAVLCHSGTELPAQAALSGSPRLNKTELPRFSLQVSLAVSLSFVGKDPLAFSFLSFFFCFASCCCVIAQILASVSGLAWRSLVGHAARE